MCVGDITKPVTLACAHSYCHECILSVASAAGAADPTTVACPVCRAPHTQEVVRATKTSCMIQAVLELVPPPP